MPPCLCTRCCLCLEWPLVCHPNFIQLSELDLVSVWIDTWGTNDSDLPPQRTRQLGHEGGRQTYFAHPFVYFIYLFIYLFILLFRATLMAYGGSQARGLIGATAASLPHSHGNARSEPRLQPTSRQHWILNPISKARDQTRNLMVPSQINFHCTSTGTPEFFFLII